MIEFSHFFYFQNPVTGTLRILSDYKDLEKFVSSVQLRKKCTRKRDGFLEEIMKQKRAAQNTLEFAKFFYAKDMKNTPDNVDVTNNESSPSISRTSSSTPDIETTESVETEGDHEIEKYAYDFSVDNVTEILRNFNINEQNSSIKKEDNHQKTNKNCLEHDKPDKTNVVEANIHRTDRKNKKSLLSKLLNEDDSMRTVVLANKTTNDIDTILSKMNNNSLDETLEEPISKTTINTSIGPASPMSHMIKLFKEKFTANGLRKTRNLTFGENGLQSLQDSSQMSNETEDVEPHDTSNGSSNWYNYVSSVTTNHTDAEEVGDYRGLSESRSVIEEGNPTGNSTQNEKKYLHIDHTVDEHLVNESAVFTSTDVNLEDHDSDWEYYYEPNSDCSETAFNDVSNSSSNWYKHLAAVTADRQKPTGGFKHVDCAYDSRNVNEAKTDISRDDFPMLKKSESLSSVHSNHFRTVSSECQEQENQYETQKSPHDSSFENDDAVSRNSFPRVRASSAHGSKQLTRGSYSPQRSQQRCRRSNTSSGNGPHYKRLSYNPRGSSPRQKRTTVYDNANYYHARNQYEAGDNYNSNEIPVAQRLADAYNNQQDLEGYYYGEDYDYYQEQSVGRYNEEAYRRYPQHHYKVDNGNYHQHYSNQNYDYQCELGNEKHYSRKYRHQQNSPKYTTRHDGQKYHPKKSEKHHYNYN